MCYRPLNIANRKLDFSLYKDQVYFTVPCGKCSECRRNTQTAWFTRAYYEYLDCVDKGGSVIYVTLTYNNEHLPHYNGVPCFSKRDVQLFFKRLRRRLNCAGIKYLITSEYGGKTHRPHLHGLIYVPFQLNALTLKQLIFETWQNGFVDFGKYGGIVNGVGAIQYVCKYICKDLDFDYDFVKENACHPFHLQSHGFGAGIILRYNLLDTSDAVAMNCLINGTIPRYDNKKLVVQVAIPQYISRKVLYDYYKDGDKVRYELNDVGKYVAEKRLQSRIDKTKEKFENLILNLNNILYEDGLEMFNNYLGSDFATPFEVRQFLKGWDFEKISIYSVVYCNRLVIPLRSCAEYNNQPSIYPYNVDSVKFQLFRQYHFEDDSEKIGIISKSWRVLSRLNLRLYNRLDVFSEFDQVLSVLNGLSYVFGVKCQKQIDDNYKLYSQLKMYKKFYGKI